MANIQKTDSELSELIEFLHSGNNEIKPFIEDVYLITVHVAGLYYVDNIEEIFPKLEKGDRLDLFREGSNKHDELAIVVKFHGEKIGYVPRKFNEILARLMDSGRQLYGVIESVSQEEVYIGDSYMEVRFKIFLKS